MKSFPKPKRVIDENVLALAKELPCQVCGKRPTDPHHIKTRGAGGGDTPENVISLCRYHHTQAHGKGMKYMAKTYYAVRFWLELKGVSL